MGNLHPSRGTYNIRNHSKRVSLELIRFNPGGISRAELARKLGLTRSALTPIIHDLLDHQLVRETENRATTGGRRPILLEMNPKLGYVAGIDMGASHLGLMVADFSAQVCHQTEVPFNVKLGPDVCLKEIDHLLRQELGKAGLQLKDLLAAGVGVPGPVDVGAGIVSAPPIMPGWDGYPIRSHLEGLLGLPVSLNNDAELGALGEWAYGAGRGERHLAYIKVGSGVGAGLLLDGHIYRGETGCAGEIGHVTVRDDGPLCTCGNHGCLEVMAGGLAIARKAAAEVRSGKRTQLSSIQPVENISARDVAAAARLGDLAAQQIITESGTYLGIAIASLINLFNPGMVVVGGGVAQMGDLLLEPIRRVVHERSLRSAAQAARINAAVLGRRSSGMGAVVQALNLALDQLA